jgi:hypothetical protein
VERQLCRERNKQGSNLFCSELHRKPIEKMMVAVKLGILLALEKGFQ